MAAALSKKSCKVMTFDEKIKILDNLRDGINAETSELTFYCCILKSNFPLKLNFSIKPCYVTCFFINIIKVYL